MKHTPGPWECSGNNVSTPKGIFELPIKGPTGYEQQWDIEEIYANARLVAAAPEMLEALKRIIAFPNLTVSIGYHGCLDDAIQQAILAVSKAEGK